MIKKVLGPPGTGKTYTLLKYVSDYINKGTPIHKIGYFAFTKVAAREAADRMIELFPDKNKKELKYFQTLHSLAFHTLGMSEDNVMQDVHYNQIGEKLSIRVSGASQETCYLDSDNEYFQLINKASIKDISIEEEFDTNEYSRKIDFEVLNTIYNNYIHFKKVNNLKDYTDMIKEFINQHQKCPQFDVIFIDEAQDLSPIQWKMYDVLKTKTKDIYLAGDDDQAIFAWAGADVKRFIEEEAEHELLQQSRRIPLAVLEQAKIIQSRILGPRIEKTYHPRVDEQGVIVEGKVEKIYTLDGLDFYQGQWLILTRAKYRADEIGKYLKEKNLYFKTRHGKSYNQKLYKAALNWTRLMDNGSILINECKDMFDFLTQDFDGEILKNKVQVTARDLGLDKHLYWYEMFNNADQKECLYIRTMLSNGEKLTEDPNIEISTIHAAKGREMQNVVLVLDNTRMIRNNIKTSIDKADEEHRVWYVGTTRSKENLYLLNAKKERHGYNL